MALALLWYAGPLGHAAAECDLFNELQLYRGLAEALQRESDEFKNRAFAESAASVGLDLALERIEALETENEELRRMYRDQEVTRELWAMRERVDSLLSRINTADVIDWTAIHGPRRERTGTEG